MDVNIDLDNVGNVDGNVSEYDDMIRVCYENYCCLLLIGVLLTLTSLLTFIFQIVPLVILILNLVNIFFEIGR